MADGDGRRKEQAQDGTTAEGETSEDYDPGPMRCVAVEFPGIVENEDRAVQMLGGWRELEEVLQGGHSQRRNIRLRFSQQSPTAIPIASRPVRSSGAMVRVRRGESGEAQSATVEAVHKEEYRFNFLADFQMVDDSGSGSLTESVLDSGGKDSAEIARNNSKLEHDAENILTVPPFFIMRNPIHYGFRNSIDESSSAIGETVPSNQHTSPVLQVIPYESAGRVPDQAIGISEANMQSKTLHLLRSVFQRRPIWYFEALKEEIKQHMEWTAEEFQQLSRLITGVAYRFKTGPWAKSWVAFGYDPRMDKEARFHQVFEIRRPDPVDQQGSSAGDAEPAPSEVHSFTRLPRRKLAHFVAGDIQSPIVRNILYEQSPAHQCTERHGWLTKEQCMDIKKVVRLKMKALNTGKGLPGKFSLKTLGEAGASVGKPESSFWDASGHGMQIDLPIYDDARKGSDEGKAYEEVEEVDEEEEEEEYPMIDEDDLG